MVSAASVNDVAEVRRLLALGTDVNIKSSLVEWEEPYTALYAASLFGGVQVVQLLLTVKGIDVNAGNESGWTPCHAEAAEGHTKILQLLLGR